MSLHPVNGTEPSGLTGHDRMTVYILARLRLVESALAAVIANSESRGSIKALVDEVLAVYARHSTEMSEEEYAMAKRGYEETYRAMFLEPAPGAAE